MREWGGIILGLMLLAGVGTSEAQGLAGVEVEGTRLTVHLNGGRVLADEALLGATLVMRSETDHLLVARIDSFAADPQDRTGEVMLYSLSTPNEDGDWVSACKPDAEGDERAILQAGPEDSIAVWCLSGALAKCVRFGYHPWRLLPDGTELAPYHRACVNLVRADYCGNDQPTTRDGMLIDVYDRVGVQQRDQEAQRLGFEAAWGEEGALCVARPRVPQNITLERLVRGCPRLADRIGAVCSEETAEQFGVPLLFNHSTGDGIPGWPDN